MKLEPGKYKIFVNDGVFGSTHFLYVFYKNSKKYFRIDHGHPQEVDDEFGEIYLDQTKILKTINKPIKVNNVRVTVTFEDEDEDQFSMSARNTSAFKRIFKLFPGVLDKFK